MKRYLAVIAILLALSAAIADSAFAQLAKSGEQKYPDVLAVNVQAHGDNRFDFDATISSPYDSEQRYADAFRVMSSDGVVFGVRTLWHDHASEQPFTRDLYGITIKAGVKSVIVQARDQKYGYGGKTVTVELPGR